MSEQTLPQEWRACLRFLRFPRPCRLPGRSPALSGWACDWIAPIPTRRLFGWALTLWVINLLALGPFVLAVFEQSGATHRIDVGLGLFTELQVGSYVFMDSQYLACDLTGEEGGAPFETSLMIDARVVSATGPAMVTLDAGF